ncbi:carboxypeptidase-like regulatory domain-containing protein [Pedobacter jeongneungensis]|uniref:carboxypeptidase-like regulatory domain-containing protein n=1 Tax=Pedobacter jeongneungensis TaxID=947309 RepID=UPI00046A3973|nr:carboxypeptidase-like regulatory domain-containing protein [Pedobacter jeongneungensis]
MQPNANGKFCGSCQKSVIDFTNFTDAELKRWFSENKGKSCGRLKPEQLDRLISAKDNYSLSRFKPSLIAASLLAFLSFPKLSDAKVIKTPFNQTDRYHSSTAFEKKTEILADTLKTIKGRVIDKDDKQPLPSVSVMVNQRLAFASTDEKGNFEIKLPANFDDESCVLTISYIGYKTLNSKVNLAKGGQLNLELCMSEYVLGGPEVVVIRHSLWRRILYKAKNQLKDINPFYTKRN